MQGPLNQGYSGSTPKKCGTNVKLERDIYLLGDFRRKYYLFSTASKYLCPNSGVRFLGYESVENVAIASGKAIHKQGQVDCCVGLTEQDI